MIKILAYIKGYFREMVAESIDEVMKIQSQVVWIDVISPSEDEIRHIQQIFDLHPLTIEDIMRGGQRPKVEDYENNLFTVIHSLKYEQGMLKVDEVYLFLSDRWLISIHRDNPLVTEVYTRTVRATAPRFQTQGPDFLYYMIVDKLVDSYFRVLDRIEDEIDDLEKKVEFNPGREVITKIGDLRDSLSTLRRSVYPSREMIMGVLKGFYPLVTDQNIAYFRDIYDHLARIMDVIEVYYGRMNSVQELYLASISASTNEVMKLFTILATIFMPATLVASIYGMNFQYIPEYNWIIGYPFALILMLIVSAIPLLLVKKKGII